MMPGKNSDLHGSAPDKSRVALLLIDVINDLEFPEADQLLQKLAVAAQNGGRCQRYLTALLLRAIALTGLDRSREALQLVNAVLTQAEPESYVRVFVDPKSFIYLHGMTLDYQETLMQQGFAFVNPNSQKSCGCGSSFSA